MIDIEYYFSASKGRPEYEIGMWLDENMPNPPLPEPQRWSLVETIAESEKSGIRFFNNEDSTLFLLCWP